MIARSPVSAVPQSKEWGTYAEKSALAQEALDAHIAYMTEIGLFTE